MDDLIRNWSRECVLTRWDQVARTWMFLAIYSMARGTAAGGTRLKHYASPRDGLADALRLAEAMDSKFLLARIPRDGAKAVLATPGDLEPPARDALLVRYGKWLASLRGLFETGADIGTSPQDMVLIAQHGSRVFGLPPEYGGTGDQGPPTAKGVLYGIEVACRHAFGSENLADRTVLVQGIGSVGRALVKLLQQSGATIKFSDLDLSLVSKLRDQPRLVYVEPEEVYSEPCDIFAPCGVGGVLTNQTIRELDCRIVAGSANNLLDNSADGELLYQRGISYAPDYVINAGAAIYGFARELEGLSHEEAEARLRSIPETLEEILNRSEKEGRSPLKTAQAIVAERRQQIEKQPKPTGEK